MTKFENCWGIHTGESLAQAIFEPNLLPYEYPNNSQIQSFYTYLPMEMEQTECSETSAYKIQRPGNYPEENIQHG